MSASGPRDADRDLAREIAEAATRPILRRELFSQPVVIQSIDVLRKDADLFLRVRSGDGAVGISVANSRMDVLLPILKKLVIPFFLGKDARELDALLDGVYRHESNYKFAGLALWCPVALVEFAILDLLGRIAKKPMAALLGEVLRQTVPIYVASGKRDNTAEQEIENLRGLVEKTGAKAIKFRVGGRMNQAQDAHAGRTPRLIELSRKTFGPTMGIHADANSSFGVEQGIEVGRMLEAIGAVYYEEPCPFDDFESNSRVAEALTIPVALGEQESSQRRFEQVIRQGIADIVQPDLFYYGGLIRSLRVARMAQARSMDTTLHLSGGFGFVYSLHFAAVAPRIGRWQEYKKGVESYGTWFDPPLRLRDGELNVPTGPGVGIADPDSILKSAVAADA